MPQICKLNNTQSCKQVIFSLEFVNIFLSDEANPVEMRCQCFYSAVMANSKLDYLGSSTVFKKYWKHGE